MNIKFKPTITILLFLVVSGIAFSQEKLSIDNCRQLALENNKKVKMSNLQTEAATQLRKAAFTQYLPNVSFNGSFTHLNKDILLLNEDKFLPIVPYSAIDATTHQINQAAFSDPAIAPNMIVINPQTGKPVMDAEGNPVFKNYAWLPQSEAELGLDNLYIAGINLIQPIYTGGKIKQLNVTAQLVEASAKENTVLETLEIIYRCEEAYWQIISVAEKVKLAQEYKKMLEKLVNDLQNYYNEGIITNNDVLKAKVKKNEVELLLQKAENGLVLSRMLLNQIIGFPLDTVITLNDSLSGFSGNDYTTDQITKAFTNRPEIKILENNVKLAMSGKKIMQSRFQPNVAFTANYLLLNPNIYNGMQDQFEGDWNVGIVCNIPITHFGERIHTLEAASVEQKVMELKLEESKELINLQINQSIFKYHEAIRKVEFTGESLKQAEENLRVITDNFLEGRLKTSDILESQALWQNAKTEYIEAKTELRLNEIMLKKVLGIL